MKSRTAAPDSAGGLKLVLRTLRYRNYRLFFGGQSISLIGTWMQRIAIGWLVYRLTNSVALLGVVGFLGRFPASILTPVAGVLADKWKRRRILVVTQTLAMSQALILAFLVMTDRIAVWHIIFLSVFSGAVHAFDIPVRQSFIVEMVGKKADLGNAIALNSAMFNAARLLGPSIAGVLIAAVGEGMCFFINGVSYLVVIAALLAMKITSGEAKSRRRGVLPELKEGFTYAFGFPPIRAILLLLGLVSLTGLPYATLMPAFARDILHGGPRTLGFLMAAAGSGALGGAVYLASRKSVVGLKKIIPLAAATFGSGLIGFSLSRIPWLSLTLMVFAGFGMMVQMASCNTILQTIVDDDKRGRVMSLYALALAGTVPFGSLLAGGVADKIGVPNTMLIGGTCCILGAALFASQLPALVEMVRPIYVKKGIVSEVALGIQSATELTRTPEM